MKQAFRMNLAKWMQLFKIASSRHDVRAIHRKQNIFLRHFYQANSGRSVDIQELAKSVAFRIHGDTHYWRRQKRKLEDLQSGLKSAIRRFKKP